LNFHPLRQKIEMRSRLERHLVKLRASQINGCAYCIDMHSKDARAGGDTEMRFYALNAWRETPFFTPRERAALAWTEALTLILQITRPMISTIPRARNSRNRNSST
jgi:AhpD family alkylhydroperoxidase